MDQRARIGGSNREFLLDVAESMLRQGGLPSLTVRNLTRTAEVNLATVNYLFGSKDGLLIALQERMLGPMTRARLEAFDRLDEAAPPAVADVLDAFVQPLIAMRREHDPAAAELYRYTIGHPEPAVRRASWELLEPGQQRLEELLVAALPDLPREVVVARAHLVCQIIVPTVLGVLDWNQRETGHVTSTDDLVAFVRAGLAGPH